MNEAPFRALGVSQFILGPRWALMKTRFAASARRSSRNFESANKTPGGSFYLAFFLLERSFDPFSRCPW